LYAIAKLKGNNVKNNTKSDIIITMNHIDNADRLFQFLKKALEVADMGGDLILKYDGAETGSKTIGHDVRIKEIRHVIYEK